MLNSMFIGAQIPLSLALIPPNATYPKGEFKNGKGQVNVWYDVDVSALRQDK